MTEEKFYKIIYLLNKMIEGYDVKFEIEKELGENIKNICYFCSESKKYPWEEVFCIDCTFNKYYKRK